MKDLFKIFIVVIAICVIVDLLGFGDNLNENSDSTKTISETSEELNSDEENILRALYIACKSNQVMGGEYNLAGVYTGGNYTEFVDLSSLEILDISDIYTSNTEGNNADFCIIEIQFHTFTRNYLSGFDILSDNNTSDEWTRSKEPVKKSFALILSDGWHSGHGAYAGMVDNSWSMQYLKEFSSYLKKVGIKKKFSFNTIDKEKMNSFWIPLCESLRHQLNSKNENTDITTQSETTQTTTTKTTITTTTTTTITTTTTTTKKLEQTEESEYYFNYLLFLDEIDRLTREEYGNIPLRHYSYYLYDIDKDGIYELILHTGESEGDSQISVYTINEEDGNSFAEVGELDGGHISLVEDDGKLYTDFRSSGHQVVEEIFMIDFDGWRTIGQATAFEQENLSEYKYYGTELKGYDISDTSAVEKLCPESLIEDESYLDSYVEEVVNTDTPLLTGVVITKTDPLNVRKLPSINAEIIGKVAKGSTIEIYSETNGWCEIRYNGQVGYVSKDFIKYN